MSSSGSNASIADRVAAALADGHAEQPDYELAFVLGCLSHAGADAAHLDQILADLAEGVSPYHVFGHFPVPGHDATVIVARDVMPPGSVTPDLIEIISCLAPAQPPLSIVDLGCGSGVLGIAALLAFPTSRGTLIDIDLGAVRCASSNITRLGLDYRATVIHGDGVTSIQPGGVDLLIANLPFVADADIPTLPARFRVHAPRVAVRGGPDGLSLLRALLPDVQAVTADNGVMILQMGDRQKNAVAAMLGERWRTATHPTFEHPNILVARRR